jgi:hypothetical protein
MSKRPSSGEPRHVRLYEWLLRCPAWRSLDVYERQLYVEFKARYTGVNNGNIGFSGEEMAEALNCSNRPADRALRTLIERGFVKIAKKGHFDWKRRNEGGSRSNTYILTEYPIDYPLKVLEGATKEFMKWRPPLQTEAPTKKGRGDVSTRMGGREHPMSRGMGGRKHPNGVSTSPHSAQNEHVNGVSTSPTYNIPQGGAVEGPAASRPDSDSRRRAA